MADHIVIGGGGVSRRDPQKLLLRFANRHGLIAGATGTGKTVTLQSMAEGFSRAGVPVFVADAKSDLAGLSQPGSETAKAHTAFVRQRKLINQPLLPYAAVPTSLLDVFGMQGVPLRVSLDSIGPMLFARMLELTDVQDGVLAIAFAVAKDEDMPIVTLDDLSAMLLFLSENHKLVTSRYGNVTPSSLGAIQRKLLMLRQQGAASFFGAPSFDVNDLLRFDARGRGYVTLLAAERLMRTPVLYSMFLLWMLNSLFTELPEVGDLDKPKLVFFFDEAHLLFNNASRSLLRMVEQIVRLIRSKGVGVYFVTQSPTDLPDAILAQLGNRVQHALRAYTARDSRAITQAAATFVRNPSFSTDEAIRTLGIGEAVTSFLDENAAPSMVQRTLIVPPLSRVGPITLQERSGAIARDSLHSKYASKAVTHGAESIMKSRAIANHRGEPDLLSAYLARKR